MAERTAPATLDLPKKKLYAAFDKGRVEKTNCHLHFVDKCFTYPTHKRSLLVSCSVSVVGNQ